jgi:hypothetical protein
MLKSGHVNINTIYPKGIILPFLEGERPAVTAVSPFLYIGCVVGVL